MFQSLHTAICASASFSSVRTRRGLKPDARMVLGLESPYFGAYYRGIHPDGMVVVIQLQRQQEARNEGKITVVGPINNVGNKLSYVTNVKRLIKRSPRASHP